MSPRLHGYTLLEVMLALLISVLVITAIGYSIDLHLRLLDGGRGEVEDAQLARALMSRLTNDLRNGVRYEKVDTSGILSVAGLSALGSASKAASSGSGSTTGGSSASKGGGTTGGGSTGGGTTGGGSSGGGGSTGSGGSSSQASSAQSQASGAAGSTSGNSSTSSSSTATVVVPGLYGTATELQIDTSRLPRVDQYGGAFAPGTLTADVVSDVKTVSYYVVDPLTAPAGQGGLVRREWDRAATRYATDFGAVDTLQTRGQVLAPEVLAIEFRYYDGTEWVDLWDSTDRQGLPMAVEVLLTMWPSREGEYPKTSASSVQVQPRQYRMLVHLVAAEPTMAGAGESTSTSTSSSGSTSSTSTTSGGGS